MSIGGLLRKMQDIEDGSESAGYAFMIACLLLVCGVDSVLTLTLLPAPTSVVSKTEPDL